MSDKKLPDEMTPEKKFFLSLSEKDKRNYAASEALKIGYHGVTEVSKRLGINKRTIRQGIKDFTSIETWKASRIRKSGGGSKKN